MGAKEYIEDKQKDGGDIMDNYSCGELSLDTDMRVVTAAGTQVALTKTECAILALLL